MKENCVIIRDYFSLKRNERGATECSFEQLHAGAERKRGMSVLHCKDAERGILRSGICGRWGFDAVYAGC